MIKYIQELFDVMLKSAFRQFGREAGKTAGNSLFKDKNAYIHRRAKK